jgi:hypothetical protein
VFAAAAIPAVEEWIYIDAPFVIFSLQPKKERQMRKWIAGWICGLGLALAGPASAHEEGHCRSGELAGGYAGYAMMDSLLLLSTLNYRHFAPADYLMERPTPHLTRVNGQRLRTVPPNTHVYESYGSMRIIRIGKQTHNGAPHVEYRSHDRLARLARRARALGYSSHAHHCSGH